MTSPTPSSIAKAPRHPLNGVHVVESLWKPSFRSGMIDDDKNAFIACGRYHHQPIDEHMDASISERTKQLES